MADGRAEAAAVAGLVVGVVVLALALGWAERPGRVLRPVAVALALALAAWALLRLAGAW